MATQTFEHLEKLLGEVGAAAAGAAGSAAAAADGAAAAAAGMLLQTVEQLERQIHSAAEGSLVLPPPPRAARSFFVANRRVCADWLGRIRGKLLRAALRARRPASVVRHGQIRLAELHARGAALCTRGAGGRAEVGEAQLPAALALLRDAEWVLMVVADALCTLGATHELGGLAIWSRRKLGPVSLAARRRPWARWIDGVRLQCAGRLEEAASALRAFLDEAATASGAAAAEPAVISYVSSHVAACHATLGGPG